MQMCRLFVGCGLVHLDVSYAAVEDFISYVVEKRCQHATSGRAASGVPSFTYFF